MVKAYVLYPVLIGTVLQLWAMRFSVRWLRLAHFLFKDKKQNFIIKVQSFFTGIKLLDKNILLCYTNNAKRTE